MCYHCILFPLLCIGDQSTWISYIIPVWHCHISLYLKDLEFLLTVCCRAYRWDHTDRCGVSAQIYIDWMLHDRINLGQSNKKKALTNLPILLYTIRVISYPCSTLADLFNNVYPLKGGTLGNSLLCPHTAMLFITFIAWPILKAKKYEIPFWPPSNSRWPLANDIV